MKTKELDVDKVLRVKKEIDQLVQSRKLNSLEQVKMLELFKMNSTRESSLKDEDSNDSQDPMMEFDKEITRLLEPTDFLCNDKSFTSLKSFLNYVNKDGESYLAWLISNDRLDLIKKLNVKKIDIDVADERLIDSIDDAMFSVETSAYDIQDALAPLIGNIADIIEV